VRRARPVPPRRPYAALLWIGLGALLLRLIYLAELRHSPLFAVVIGDALQYDVWAQDIASGHWLGSEIFYQTPLYPYLLAIVFKIAGHHLLVVRVIQSVMGAASCVMLGAAGRQWFGERVGLIAAALLAVYPPAIFFDGLIQKASLDLFLVTLLIVVIGEFEHRRQWPWLVAAGVALGAFTLNRENARVLYPILAVWLVMGFRAAPLTQRMAWVAIFTASIAGVLVPVGARNYHVGHEFLVSTSQLGPNFYIGNHADASGTYESIVPDRGNAIYERADATRLAQEATGRTLSPSEVSSYWLDRSLDYIRHQPIAWLTLMGKKVLLTFSAGEVTDTESIRAYADESLLLRSLQWLTFGIILPLAVLGVWLTRAEWRRISVLYAIGLGLGLAVALFFVLARYRYPIVSIVVLFAASALAALPAIAADRRRRWIPGALAAVLVAWPVNFLMQDRTDGTYVNVGSELIRTGRPADAIPILIKAVNAAPSDATARFNLGVAYDATGQKPQAAEQFNAALQIRPSYFEARNALALTLKDTGNAADALAQFRQAVAQQPGSAEAHSNLGNALAQAGDQPGAIAEFRQSLSLNANDAAAHNGLAEMLRQGGDTAGAIHEFEAALKIKPAYPEALNNLALALESTGRAADAADHFSDALRLQPTNVGMHLNFGDLLLTMGRTDEALGHYSTAVSLAPDSIEALYRLAQAYAASGRLHDAAATLEKALALAQTTGQRDAAQRIDEALKIVRAKIKI
jgi:tetratricopeptide (TPR) repeat protein